MKTSVSMYSFSALTRTGKMTYMEGIHKAKELGFQAVDIAGLRPLENGASMTEDTAKEIRGVCADIGLEIASYTIGGDLVNGYAGGSARDEVARLKKEVDVAAVLGAPSMRHDATWGFKDKAQRGWRGFDNALPQLVEGIRAITEYAASAGVRTTVENHGLFAQDSYRMEKLINSVAHDNFGLICDIGNFLCVDENPITAVSRVAPYAFFVHAKDFHVKSGSGPHPGKGFFETRGGNYLRGAIIGHGDVPVQQCLRILKNAGYDGYVSIEFEGMEDPILGVSVGLENLENYIAAL